MSTTKAKANTSRTSPNLKLLILSANSWIADIGENATIEVPYTAEPTEAIAELAEKLHQKNSITEDITLALDASHFFTAALNTSDLSRSAKHQTLVYRLEELLPIDAEHFTADFLTINNSAAIATTLAVALITDKTSAIIKSLEASNLLITSIISSDIAVATEILATQNSKLTGSLNYLVFDDKNPKQSLMHIFCVAGGQLTKWLNCTGKKAFERILRSELLHNPLDASKKAIIAMPADFDKGKFDNLNNENIELVELQCNAYCQLLADAVNTGREPIELRQGELAASRPWARVSGHLKLAGVMFTIFWLVLIGALIHRTNSFEKQAAGYKHQLRSQFCKLYPDSTPPANILGRLKSELEKSGASTTDDDMPQQSLFALDNLRRLMANIPQDMRLRILNLAISPDNIVIDGQLRSHGDAEKLRESIAGKFLRVDPPRTERINSESVSFTMTARPRVLSTGAAGKKINNEHKP